jgi:hypothetical protein
MPIYMKVDGVDGPLFMSPPKHLETVARQTLQTAGVSQQGVDQFLKGRVVVNLADRSKLASMMVRNLSITLKPVYVTS